MESAGCWGTARYNAGQVHCLCFPSPHNGSSISGQTGRGVGWDGDCSAVFFSPYFPHSHVCWLPSLAARGPGQPPHSCRRDREAADARAASTGRSEARTGKAGLGQDIPLLGDVACGSCLYPFCGFGFILILLGNFLCPFPREVFSTSLCLFVCLLKQDLEQKMKVVENLQDDFDFNYKTLKSQGGKWILETLKSVESEFV